MKLMEIVGDNFFAAPAWPWDDIVDINLSHPKVIRELLFDTNPTTRDQKSDEIYDYFYPESAWDNDVINVFSNLENLVHFKINNGTKSKDLYFDIDVKERMQQVFNFFNKKFRNAVDTKVQNILKKYNAKKIPDMDAFPLEGWSVDLHNQYIKLRNWLSNSRNITSDKLLFIKQWLIEFEDYKNDRSSNLIPDEEKWAKFLWQNCGQFLRDSEFQPLYRGINQRLSFKSIAKVLQYPVAGRSTASNVSNDAWNLINKYMKDDGFNARRDNSILCTGSIYTAKDYGYVYLVFPYNNYHFSWSSDIFDYFNKILDKTGKEGVNSYDMEEFWQEWGPTYKSEKDSKISQAINSGNEILLTGNKYVLMPIKFADTIYPILKKYQDNN